MLPRLDILHVLTLMLLSEFWPKSCADVFSAMFKMEHLLETRQRVIQDLDAYIHKEENRMRDLKMYLKIYHTEHERAMKDMTHYTGNPINAFILIKRLTSDLDDIEERINKPIEFVSVRNVTRDSSNATILYPTAVDLQGAALALKRLQKTYKLKVEDLANGVLNGVVYSDNHNIAIGQPLTASDCYKIGVIMFKKRDYMNALAWQMEALRKFKLEDSIPHSFSEIDIMHNIGNIYYYLGDRDTATEWTAKILELDPDNEQAQINFLKYDAKDDDSENEDGRKSKNADVKNENKEDSGIKNDLDTKTIDGKNETDSKIYIVVNEEDDGQNEKDGKLETCPKENTYKNGTTNKDVVISTKTINNAIIDEFDVNKVDSKSETNENGEARNVTHDETDDGVHNDTSKATSEKKRQTIDYLVQLRNNSRMSEALCRGEYDIAPEISSRLTCHYLNDKPFLKLAPIKAEQRYIDPDVFLFYNVISDEEIALVQEIAKPYSERATVGNNTVSGTRISETSWLEDEESEIVARLSQRIGDCSGFDMQNAEWLQVSNYGVGGHFQIHYDFSLKEIKSDPIGSHRIATAMFYLSDVKQGGATVFPKLGLTVFPVKGSVLFWKNLLPSGEGDINTLHAACPVLEGCKWVANKWILNHGQELTSPCLPDTKLRSGYRPPAPVLKTDTLV